MPTQRYRLQSPTIAAVLESDKYLAYLIPAGDEILVLEDIHHDLENTTRQVTVHWEGKKAFMFACDIRGRGDLIE
jgi:hypothetical protein